MGPRGIVWNHSYWGEVARGVISADMSDPDDAWFCVQIGNSIQRMTLVSRPRHFGGRQWFFLCPATYRIATVLWKPPGASRFCSRHTWGRQVAYQSQFQNSINRAHLGKERIKSRLIGSLDPDEWELPPKPKWMRWDTYNRYEQQFDRYEEILDYGLAVLAAKLSGLKIF